MPRTHISPLPHLALVPAYASAEKPAGDGNVQILLSQNELGVSPSPLAVAAAIETIAGSNRYPDSDCINLRTAIAKQHGLNIDRIVCSPGSMLLLSSLIGSYAGQGDEVIVSRHGYAYFQTIIQLAGAEPIAAAEVEYRADVDAILSCVSERTRIVLLANPNNPTGTHLPWSEIQRLHSSLPRHVLLVLDGAYAEFVTASDFNDGANLVDICENVAMIRTFSKIYGLAGMRVGWGYFPAAVADMLRRVLPPSGVSVQAQAAAVAAISDRTYLSNIYETIHRERVKLYQQLEQLGLPPVASETNFMLADFGSSSRAQRAYRWLTGQHVHLRPVGSAGLPQHLRITIGTPAENEQLIKALRQFCAMPDDASAEIQAEA